MKSEDIVQQEIQLEAAKYGIALLRNNSGALADGNGRIVRYGLGHVSSKQIENFKSSDLISLVPITITSEMVGQTIGVFIAVEVKREDWKFKVSDKRAVAQKNFIDWVIAHGGIANFCTSVDDFKKLIGR
jgi:hypothetical protein